MKPNSDSVASGAVFSPSQILPRGKSSFLHKSQGLSQILSNPRFHHSNGSMNILRSSIQESDSG
jgi:hypothetical protein